MKKKILKVHPDDNVLVALTDLSKGELLEYNGIRYELQEAIPAKHKFTTESLPIGGEIRMYGVLVGKATLAIPVGSRITTSNLQHATEAYKLSGQRKLHWPVPDITAWSTKTFMGYYRSDGSVGTANYWLIIPMVFCENRNVDVLKEALLEELGYARPKIFNRFTKQLVELYRSGTSAAEIQDLTFEEDSMTEKNERLFRHVDGIKFLVHEGGCGGTRQDAQALCGLLAGYITHPNVAGATVLSLGCQNAQVSLLTEEIKKRTPRMDKPLYILEQQKIGNESMMVAAAVKKTFAGLAIAADASQLL